MIPSNWKTILTPQTLLYPRDVPTENFLLSPDVCIVNSATNHIAIINQLIRSLPKLQDRGHRFPFDFGPCALVRSAYPCAKYSSFACSPSHCVVKRPAVSPLMRCLRTPVRQYSIAASCGHTPVWLDAKAGMLQWVWVHGFFQVILFTYQITRISS